MNLKHFILIPRDLYMLTLFVSVGYMLTGELAINPENSVLLLLEGISSLLLITLLLLTFQKYSFRENIVILLALFLSAVVGTINGRWFEMIAACILVVGARNILYREILKCYLTIGSFVCISMVTLSLLGLKSDKVAVNMSSENFLLDELSVRHSFGYVWPTDFATHVFFILLVLWILKNGKLSHIMRILYAIISVLIIVYSDSRLGAGCIMLLILASFFSLDRGNVGISKCYFFAIWCVPLMAITIFLLTIEYDSTNLNWITLDLLLSRRLSISQSAIQEAGVSLWGTEYIMYGGDNSGALYNFIDSSYLQLIVLYGIVYTVIYLLLFSIVGYQSYKRCDRVILVALLVAGFSGIISQHFLQIYMNPLLVALTAKHSSVQ